MENIVGYPKKKERDHILSLIYGAEGLVENTDSDTFNYRLKTIYEEISAVGNVVDEKKFMTYFDKKLLPLLQIHVIEPIKKGKISSMWTNNNCESANHILKSATGWKMKNIISFIECLFEIVKGEQEERCRAIRDLGNFRLCDRYQHHKIDIDRWSTMSQDNRDNRRKRFLTDAYGKNNPKTWTIQRTPSAGRKLNQRKGKRAEKSRTPSCKRML